MALKINEVYNIDSRNLDEIIKEPVVDITITSPPYFDLKDYGHKNQIGFGQSYENYLNDLKTVFSKVYNVTKDDGTLWVIIDTYRKDGEMFTLPFDFSNKLKEVGWKLQEIIIWQKDKTVPWTHNGQMRNIFEYILLFCKSEKFKFNIDKIREHDTLKKWWVKYPERYNPRGKAPDAIWNFPIPTQGSWGKGYVSHFCPLPDGLIKQILKVGSNKNDLVLDPFSGSGAVLCSAYTFQRKYIGIELNKEYIEKFKNYLSAQGAKMLKQTIDRERTNQTMKDFKTLILKLRVLKFGRLLLKKSASKYGITRIIVNGYSEIENGNDKIIKAEYLFLANKKVDKNFQIEINTLITKPPLSKFGIIPSIKVISINSLLKNKNYIGKKYYTYSISNTHHFINHITFKNMDSLNSKDAVLSSIKVNLNESDYE